MVTEKLKLCLSFICSVEVGSFENWIKRNGSLPQRRNNRVSKRSLVGEYSSASRDSRQLIWEWHLAFFGLVDIERLNKGLRICNADTISRIHRVAL